MECHFSKKKHICLHWPFQLFWIFKDTNYKLINTIDNLKHLDWRSRCHFQMLKIKKLEDIWFWHRIVSNRPYAFMYSSGVSFFCYLPDAISNHWLPIVSIIFQLLAYFITLTWTCNTKPFGCFAHLWNLCARFLVFYIAHSLIENIFVIMNNLKSDSNGLNFFPNWNEIQMNSILIFWREIKFFHLFRVDFSLFYGSRVNFT